MINAQELILRFNELPPDEQQVFIDYMESRREETFKVTHYSPEEMAIIDRRDEETRQGVNIEKYSSMSEARKALGLIQ